jgi:hypothetical protein
MIRTPFDRHTLSLMGRETSASYKAERCGVGLRIDVPFAHAATGCTESQYRTFDVSRHIT